MTKLIKVANWSGKARGHVIFVHGLGGHAYDTWRHGADDGSFWPGWLSRDIKGLTVWTLSYEAPPINWLGTALPLQDRAGNVLELLLSQSELSDAPLVFVCHSLGGLVIKQMLRAANDQKEHRAEAGDLIKRTQALVFIATPHTGSTHASWLDRLRIIAWPSTASQDLIKNDPNLRNLNVWYRNWQNHIAHHILYEMQATNVGIVVSPGSADAGLPGVTPVAVDADHIGICKPKTDSDLIYTSILTFLKKVVTSEEEPTKRYKNYSIQPQQIVSQSKPKAWVPIALRLAILIIIGFIGFMGIKAIFFPIDPLTDATIQQIEGALRHKRQDLNSEQIERFMASLREARGDPSFEKAVEEARKGNTRVAEGIWRQIYEDRKKQQSKALKEQAEAARNLAAVTVIESVAEGLRWYREATQLDPQNMDGWHGLGNAAMSGGITEEADQAFRQFHKLAIANGDSWNETIGHGHIGNVYYVQGKLEEALERYQASLTISERLTQSDPSNSRWQRALSVSHERVGDVFMAQGKLGEALERYQASLTIAERFAQSDPSDSRWQRRLSISHERVGDVFKVQGKLGKALERYQASLAISERLAQSDPSNSGWQSDLSISNTTVGVLFEAQGKLGEALERYQASLAISERLTQSDPSNSDWQLGLSVSHERVGDVFMDQGKLGEALERYQASLAIRARLAQSDPSNSDWQLGLSISHERVGEVFMAQRNHGEALKRYQVSLAIIERLTQSDPSNSDWQRGLYISHCMVGDVFEAQGNLGEALERYKVSLAIIKRLRKSDPTNSVWENDWWYAVGKLTSIRKRWSKFSTN